MKNPNITLSYLKVELEEKLLKNTKFLKLCHFSVLFLSELLTTTLSLVLKNSSNEFCRKKSNLQSWNDLQNTKMCQSVIASLKNSFLLTSSSSKSYLSSLDTPSSQIQSMNIWLLKTLKNLWAILILKHQLHLWLTILRSNAFLQILRTRVM